MASKKKRVKRSVFVILRATPQERKALARLARKHGMSVSEFLMRPLRGQTKPEGKE